MENVKLTLSVPKNMIGPFKKYVSEKQTSISKLFTKFMSQELKNHELETEISDDEFLEKINKIPISPAAKKLSGILKGSLKDGEDYRDVYREHISKKNGF